MSGKVPPRLEKTAEGAVALLTGGGDRPYAFGLATELMAKGMSLDIVAGNDLDCPEFRNQPGVTFFNLRGDQSPDVAYGSKVLRVLRYYARLIRYAATAKPRLFHILWNNKFQLFDRTLLMLYYKALKKRIVLTVHNVNAGRRDSNDSYLNRFTLRIQYRLADHIFVHTAQMKCELRDDFEVPESKIAVIPFGINNSVPNTDLSPSEARTRLGLLSNEQVILFFGNITPYKGLEYLVDAFQQLAKSHPGYRLVIAGRPKDCDQYWNGIAESIRRNIPERQVLVRTDYIPDEETEIFFKAADVLVLPYRHIYQSGVLFLGYSFGLPALVADVGSLREDVVEGETGFVFKPENIADLAAAIERYFSNNLYKNLSKRRREVRDYALARHSWDEVGRITLGVYADVLRMPQLKERVLPGVSTVVVDSRASSESQRCPS